MKHGRSELTLLRLCWPLLSSHVAGQHDRLRRGILSPLGACHFAASGQLRGWADEPHQMQDVRVTLPDLAILALYIE